MIKYAIALAVLIALATYFCWAFLPARYLPGNRVRSMQVRLHLRLHPGKGFAHVFSLWLRWSRFAVLRRSGQIRPALPWRCSLLDPREHSVFLGRAHYRHRLRVPLEEHLLVMAPPRTYKAEAPTAAWLMRSTPPEPRPSGLARLWLLLGRDRLPARHHPSGRSATLGITSRAQPFHTRQRQAVSHGRPHTLLSLNLWV